MNTELAALSKVQARRRQMEVLSTNRMLVTMQRPTDCKSILSFLLNSPDRWPYGDWDALRFEAPRLHIIISMGFIDRTLGNIIFRRSPGLTETIGRLSNHTHHSTTLLIPFSFCFRQSCQHCVEQFSKKEDLIDHLRNEHTDLIFLCDVCKDYLPRSNLLEHMTSHALSLAGISAAANEEIKCEKCDKTFPTDKKLERHQKMAHQKPPKLFQCTDCNKIFNTNRVLQNHCKHKHSDARKYNCDLCQKSFKTDSGLYAHRKTHADSYDYSCQICLKKFKFKVHLARHLTVHTQEKNFFCRFCSKSFGVKDNLNKHLRTHYKLFEFKCHICEFMTSQQRYLTMHMKTSHLVKP